MIPLSNGLSVATICKPRASGDDPFPSSVQLTGST